MDTYVYTAPTSLTGLKGSKKDEIRPKTIHDLDDAVRQKRTETLKQNGQLIRLSIKITTFIFQLTSGTVRRQRRDLWKNRFWILH